MQHFSTGKNVCLVLLVGGGGGGISCTDQIFHPSPPLKSKIVCPLPVPRTLKEDLSYFLTHSSPYFSRSRIAVGAP